MLFMSCICHAFASVYRCLVVTCCEGLTSWLSFVMFNCLFVTFPCCILGQLQYLIVSIPDLCQLSYFVTVIVLWFFLTVHRFDCGIS